MPRYDYECIYCNNIQEESHPMAGPDKKIKCEKCGKGKMTRVISSPYVRFDGPGWQTNDNRGIAKPGGGSDIDSSAFGE